MKTDGNSYCNSYPIAAAAAAMSIARVHQAVFFKCIFILAQKQPEIKSTKKKKKRKEIWQNSFYT